MNLPFIFAAAGLAESAKETAEQFGWQKQLFFSQVISFCVIAFLLQRFAYKPIINILEERRKRIA